MVKKLASLIAISSFLILASCSTGNQTARLSNQNDDVYYSAAQAREVKEAIPPATAVENKKPDYVTDKQLYGDAYDDPYYDSYASRIYRFRDYAPWRGYYSDFYHYYDPYYNSSYYPFYPNQGGLSISLGYGYGYFNNYYNPWRYYGFYSSNFWGPYSYYNYWQPSFYGYYPGIGYGGYYGGYYGGGYGIGRPGYTSPNYRARPVRSSDSFPVDKGAVNGAAAGGISRGGNADAIQSGGTRARSYTEGNPAASGSRPQSTTPRPERVNRAQPQRVSQPERIQSRPSPSNNNSGGNSGRSGSGSSGGGGARPSRN